MLEGLFTAAAGMAAQQEQLDAISNDLANVSTTGYQSQRVAFSDLLYNQVSMAGTESTEGAGASARTIGHSEAQGSIRETGDPLDLAIEGDGYFQITLSDGKVALSRDGSFGLDASGTLVNSEGDRLTPPIKLPKGVSPSDVTISPDGTVAAAGRTLGKIQVVTVASPQHLLTAGSSVLTPTPDSGAPHPVTGARIHQGTLEGSNVDIARDMALMVSTQRNFQMSSTAIQDDNQMMTIANQLRPGS